MTSMPSTTTSKRRLLAGGAAAALVVAGAAGWWLSRSDLPSDWPERAHFCAQAKAFVITNQEKITGAERVAALKAMIESSPEALQPDLKRLANSMVDDHQETAPDSHDSPEAIAASGAKAGQFIERTCGINLPNIRT
jgi:hypothetical protein